MIDTRQEKELASQIAASNFDQMFGGSTLSEALRTPMATQSTRVRRAIKDSYKKNIDQENAQNSNQTFEHISTDDSFNAIGESVQESSGDIDSFEETDIYVVINGVAELKTFLTKDASQ
jgi:hypothetical protein